MAHTPYLGSEGTTITYGGASIPTGWHMITITENFKARPAQIDKTKAGDATYQWKADPLGGEGQANCTVEVDAYLSVTDHQDTGMLASALDGTGAVVVQKDTGTDKFTATGATFSGLDVGDAFAEIQPAKWTFNLASSAGAWSAS